MGIAIDILVGLFLLWSLLRGWKVGFLYQIAHLAFLVVAYFAARGLTALLEKQVTSAVGVSPLIAGTVTFFAIFAILGLIGALLVRRMTRDLIPDSSALSDLNRFFGAVTGLAKGGLYAYVIIVLLLQVQRISGKTWFPWQTSTTASLAAKHNFLDRREVEALFKLVWLASTRDLETLAKDPRAAPIVRHPKAKVLYSPEVLSAIGNQDYVTLLANDALWDFLDEPDVQKALEEFEWVEGEAPARP